MLKTLSLILSVIVVTVSCISKPNEGAAPRKPSQAAVDTSVRKYPPEQYPSGFAILDVLVPTKDGKTTIQPYMSADDLKKVADLKLKPFKPIYNFDEQAANKPNDAKEPWLDANLDITQRADAEKLAKILQAYVYEGWFNLDQTASKTDYDSHFRQNKLRTWCQSPWLNVSEKGREAIHGLTKEFPISTTSVYTVPDDIDQGEHAVSWGVGFFNRKVCDNYDHLFHPSKFDPSIKDYEAGIAKGIADHTISFNAKDGAVSFKLLFSAMENWEDNMKGQWDGAYAWNAHVSHDRQPSIKKGHENDTYAESQRQLMRIPHVQMDVGFKDSRVKGTNPKLKNWAMMTYYFDPNYNGNELLKDMKIPEALKHMRPAGLQYGMDAGQTHIFDGSRNNHRPQGTELPYDQTRLNGPVDNKQSSCLSCHGTSGINFGLPDKGHAPGLGFLTQAQYEEYLAKANGHSFDFDMQIDKGMRNFALIKNGKVMEQNQK